MTRDICLWFGCSYRACLSQPLTTCSHFSSGSKGLAPSDQQIRGMFPAGGGSPLQGSCYCSGLELLTHLLHFKHRGTPFHTLSFSYCLNTVPTHRRLMLQAWPCWAADYWRIDGSEKPGLVTEMGCLPQRAAEPGGLVLLSAPSVKREVPIITQVLLAQLMNSHAHRALSGLLGSRSVWERGHGTLQRVRWNGGCVSTWTGSLGLSAKLSSAFDAAFVSWPRASVNKAP